MKKIILLLLITVASYGQTLQNPTFGTIKLKTSPTVTASTNITTTETDGTQGKILGENISLSVIPPVTHFTPLSASIKGYFQGVDTALGNIPVTFDSDDVLNRSTVSGATATDALNNLNTGLASKVNGTGVAGQVSFWSGTNVQSGNSSLSWNIANKFLGVGSANPDQKLTISSNTPNLVHLENAITTSNGSHDVKIDCFKNGLGYNNLVLSAYNFKLLSAGVNEVFSVSNGGNATISSTSNPSMSFSGPTASGVVGWSGSNFRMINFSGSGGVTIQSNGSVDINTQGGSVITFGTSATERARITSGGNLLCKTVIDNGQGVIQANGNITASPATLPNQVVVYSQLGVQPKKYTALISQSGTSAPTVTVLENALGGTVVWTRNSTGVYWGTLSGAFTASKTACIHQKSGQVLASSYTDYYLQGDLSNNFLTLRTKQSGSFTDGLLLNDTIKIEVYP